MAAKTERCPGCGGLIAAGTRKITLERALENHAPTCPGRYHTLKEES